MGEHWYGWVQAFSIGNIMISFRNIFTYIITMKASNELHCILMVRVVICYSITGTKGTQSFAVIIYGSPCKAIDLCRIISTQTCFLPLHDLHCWFCTVILHSDWLRALVLCSHSAINHVILHCLGGFLHSLIFISRWLTL